MVSRPYHHGNLKETLVAAGLRRLARDGARRLSLRSLAREIGVSPMAPYKHFRDKEALLAALAETGFAQLAQRIRTERERHAGRPAEALEAAGRAYVELALENPPLLQLMFSGVCPAVQSNNTEGTAFGELLHVVEDAQKAGLIPAGDPLPHVLVAWATAHGAAVMLTGGPLKKDSPFSKDLPQRVIQTVTAGFRSLATPPSKIKRGA